jgi:hypothetical protein
MSQAFSGGLSFNSSGVGSALGDLGGAVGSIFQGIGDEASATAYDQAASFEGNAANIAGENANIATTAAALQASQQQRQIYGVEGGQQSDVAGAGLKAGGSNAYLLQSTAQQGALSVGLIKQQGELNTLGYQQQQQGLLAQQTIDQGLASATQAAGTGAFIGGALKGVAGLAALVSL